MSCTRNIILPAKDFSDNYLSCSIYLLSIMSCTVTRLSFCILVENCILYLTSDLNEFHGEDQGSSSWDRTPSSTVTVAKFRRNVSFWIKMVRYSRTRCVSTVFSSLKSTIIIIYNSYNRIQKHFVTTQSNLNKQIGTHNSHLAPSFINCIASVQPLMTWLGASERGSPRL